MTHGRLTVIRGDLVIHSLLISDQPDEVSAFRQIRLADAFQDGDIIVSHGKDANAAIEVAWAGKKKPVAAVKPGEVVRLVRGGATMEIIHYPKPAKLPR